MLRCWARVTTAIAQVPLPRGYRFALLARDEFPSLAEAIGRAIGMGMIYGMATLKVPHVQRSFEKLGWDLIGITPGIRSRNGRARRDQARL
jgi:hypothetical protein